MVYPRPCICSIPSFGSKEAVKAKCAGLDAICLTEHFNTQQFELLYRYIATQGTRQGDAYVFDGLKIFPGMETDITLLFDKLKTKPNTSYSTMDITATYAMVSAGLG